MMVYSPRIGPDGAFIREFSEVRKKVQSLETRASGNIVIRETLSTVDPETGVETVLGKLPDGSYGIQPFVGDTTPPPVASQPLVTVQPGIFSIAWDGLFVANAEKPRDFVHVNVIGYKMSGESTVSSAVVGIIRLANDSVLVTHETAAVGETWQFALEAVDYNGNKALPGVRSASVVMPSIVSDQHVANALQAIQDDADAAQQAATNAQTAAGTAQSAADALKAAAGSIIVNGNFDMPIVSPPTGWPTRVLTYVEANAGARSGANVMRSAPTTNISYAYSDYVESAKGRTYYMEMWVKLATSVTTGDLGFYFSYVRTDGVSSYAILANLENITSANLSTTEYTKVSVKYTSTLDITKARFGPRMTGNGNVYLIDDFKVLDITHAEAAQVVADQAASQAANAATAAGNAQTAADSKNRVWYQTTAPAGTAHKVGDTWYDTDDGNRVYLWSGSAWADFQDTAIAAASQQANAALTSANGKNKNYYQPEQPSGGTYLAGDTWFDTDDGNKMYSWSGSAWVLVQDSSGALSIANTKNRTFIQGTAPTASAVGDIWIDSSAGNQINRWSGSAWIDARDTTIASAQSTANTALTSANGKNRTYYQTSMPTGGTYISGDTWFDTDDGNKIYVHNGTTWVASELGTSAIANLAITTAKVSELDAGKISSGYIESDRIKANSIDAQKMVIGRGANLYVDEAVADTAFYATSSYVDPVNGRNGKGSILIPTGTTQAGTYYAVGSTDAHKARRVRVVAGQVYRVGAWVRTSTAAPANTVAIYVRLYRDIDNAVVFASPSSITNDGLAGRPGATTANTWVWLSGMVTVPASTEYTGMSLGFFKQTGYTTGTTRFSDPTVQQVATGELVVDGLITANSAIIATGAIGTAHIGDAAITTAKIENLAVTNAKVVALDAAKMTTGYLDAARIDAGSLSADKILVSNSTNVLIDPAFSIQNIIDARTTNSTGGKAGWAIVAATATTPRGLSRTTTTTNDIFHFNTSTPISAAVGPSAIQVNEGQKWLFTFDVTTDISAGVRVNMHRWFADGTSSYIAGSSFNTAVGKRSISYVYTIPAGVVSIYPSLACNTAGTAWTVHGTGFVGQQAKATLIEDGAVTTSHMTAGTINASVLTAGSITAPKIAAKTITTDKLVVSSTDNLVVEADFANNGSSWELGANVTIDATAGRGSLPAMKVTGTTSAVSSRNLLNKFVVNSASRFRGSLSVKSTAALPAGAILLKLRCYTTAILYTEITVASSPALVANTWTQIGGTAPDLPSGTVAAEVLLSVTNDAVGTVTNIDFVGLTRAADASLVVDGAVTASKLESTLVLATKIIAGSATGTHAAMEPDGFRVYASDPSDGIPNEVVRMGVPSSGDFFALTKADGSLAAAISENGVLSASGITTTGSLTYKGFELSALLDERPRGHVVSALRTTSSGVNASGTTEQPYLRLEAPLKAGRLYKVWTSNIRMDIDSGTTAHTYIRQNSSGIATLSSPAMTQSRYTSNATSYPMSELYALSGSTDATVSFLISFGVSTGSGQAGIRASATETVRLTVEDIGPLRSTGNGVWIDGTTAPPAPVNTYVKQYGHTDSMNYQGNNNQYLYDLGRMYQGLSPSSYGNLKSLATYPDMTADLAGATINYIRVYINFEFWYYNSGGTARIGLHGHSAIPGTFTGSTLVETVPGWPKPGALWINLSPALYNGFKTGAYRGVTLEGDGTYQTYGYAQRPIIEISYSK